MADGPDYEKLFRDMKCLNTEHNLDVIVKYLRFTADEKDEPYSAHYLPMLPSDVAAEFAKAPNKVKEEVEEVVEEAKEESPSISAPKKRGRPSKQ